MMTSIKIEEILQWDSTAVEQFLVKNKIYGCKSAIVRNNIDGRAFLNLDHQSLAKWGITTVQQSKILDLMSSLGSEKSNKQISSTAPPLPVSKKSPYPTLSPSNKPLVPSGQRFCPPIATVKPNLPRNQKQSSNASLPSSKRDQMPSALSSPGPALPPKPAHLRPTPISSSSHIVSNNEDNYLTPISKMDSKSCNSNSSAGNFFETDHHSIDSFTSDEDFGEDSASHHDDGEIINDENYEDPDECQHQANKLSEEKKEWTVKAAFSKFFITGPVEERSKPGSGDPPVTPPLPPTRPKGLSHSSSQSSLVSGSSPVPPSVRSNLPPQSAGERSSPWKSSQSSLADSLPSNPPPPVPVTPGSNPTFPSKLNPTQGSRHNTPPFRQSNEWPRTSPTPSVGSSCDRGSSDSEANIQPWYFNVERRQAESCLVPCRDGTFLIRPSKHGGKDSPFTLSLQYNQRIFHVLIRRRPDGKLALGTEKPGEDAFPSITALVQHHQKEPMHLHAGSKIAGTTILTQWPDNPLA